MKSPPNCTLSLLADCSDKYPPAPAFFYVANAERTIVGQLTIADVKAAVERAEAMQKVRDDAIP